jgi:hypothetical protein
MVNKYDGIRLGGVNMDKIEALPDHPIVLGGLISNKFLKININTFLEACRFVHKMPYGYNSDRDDLLILFKENKGTCTTKHSVIGTLSAELGLGIHKTIGIYAMTEAIVTGTKEILHTYALPFVPMVHCYLAHDGVRVDLTEGNDNGKNRSIETFLYTQRVQPNISAKNEYLLYRNALKDLLAAHEDLAGIEMKTILHAREEGLKLLKSKIN